MRQDLVRCSWKVFNRVDYPLDSLVPPSDSLLWPASMTQGESRDGRASTPRPLVVGRWRFERELSRSLMMTTCIKSASSS
jgi:hypothetical protein